MGDLLFNIISFQNVSNKFKNYYKSLKFDFKSKNFKNTEKYTLKKMCLCILIYYFIKYILCSSTNNKPMLDLRRTRGYPCLRCCWYEDTFKYMKKLLTPGIFRSSIYIRAPVAGTYDINHSGQNLQG